MPAPSWFPCDRWAIKQQSFWTMTSESPSRRLVGQHLDDFWQPRRSHAGRLVEAPPRQPGHTTDDSMTGYYPVYVGAARCGPRRSAVRIAHRRETNCAFRITWLATAGSISANTISTPAQIRRQFGHHQQLARFDERDVVIADAIPLWQGWDRWIAAAFPATRARTKLPMLDQCGSAWGQSTTSTTRAQRRTGQLVRAAEMSVG